MEPGEKVTLFDGYDTRATVRRIADFRLMTVAEAKELPAAKDLPFLESGQESVRMCRMNGKVKRWKRSPNRIEVPVKYGLYECTRLENLGDGGGDPVGNMGVRLLVQLTSWREV